MKKLLWGMTIIVIVTYSANLISEVPQSAGPVDGGSLSSGIYSQCFAKIPGVGSEGLDLIAPQLATTVASAFNPVLIMLAIGSCTYFSSDTGTSELPFPAQPWFLLTLGVFAVSFVLKDYLLALLPAAKMPLDGIEAVVQAISTPIAVTLFMTSLSGSMQTGGSNSLASLLGAGPDFIALEAGLGSTLGELVGGVLVVAGLAYILVFALALHFLIALCPVPILDTVIKYIRNGVCLLLILTSLVSPILGLMFLLLVAYVSYKLGDAAFRSATTGLFYLLNNFSRKQKPFSGVCWAATRQITGIKNNVIGKFSINHEGICQFAYRPYLIFKTRKVTLKLEDPALKQGFFSLLLVERYDGLENELLSLPATYRDALGEKFTTVTDDSETMGFTSGLRWFKEQFYSSQTPATYS